jgi:RNA polymerase primary sigma factor
VYWLRQSVLKCIHDNQGEIRFPDNIIQKICKLEKEQSRLLQIYGDPYSTEQISRQTGISEEKILEISEYSRMYRGKRRFWDDMFLDMEGKSRLPRYSISDGCDGEMEIEKVELRHEIDLMLSRLKPKEERVIRLHFGLDGEKTPMDLASIGRLMDLTKERIRQIKEKAMKKLRSPERNKRLNSYLV